MKISEDKLRKLLVEPGYLTEEEFNSAQEEAKLSKAKLEDVLVVRDYIKDKYLGEVIADLYNVSYVNLFKEKIEDQFISMIPEIVARSKGVVAFGSTKEGIKIGMLYPDDWETLHLIEKRFGCKVMPYYITKRGLENSLSAYKLNIKDKLEELAKKLNTESIQKEDKDKITVELVDKIFHYGFHNKVSDIHIEPYVHNVMVRFRIDGVLHDVLELPKNLLDLILTRIKILAKMRTDEHRSALDGKLRFNVNDEIVDVRVSIIPVTEGENVVMRLLSSKSRQLSLHDLGFSNSDFEIISKAIRTPHGMILVTGPTGSGKTTTVYEIMKLLNKRDVHISSIEDPVEYDIEGISQIQVNTKTNLTFAKGLRAIVRQDPDIIMVGEIRDKETAAIAVNSAMTGHLVLSTLHANDAATTLPRLLDMDIEAYLISSTVNIIIAQRLVRKICEKCRVSYHLSIEDEEIINKDKLISELFVKAGIKDLNKARLYRGNGCKVCANTGFNGRIGIFEILKMNDQIKKLVMEHASGNQIMEAAKGSGMNTMIEDGIKKVLEGLTTFNEVLRITGE